MSIAAKKVSWDWCHLCGYRKQVFVEVDYPLNAEHGPAGKKYIRMCVDCVAKLQAIGDGPEEGWTNKWGNGLD